ncbi:drug/metabolite transporter (DMT)-like permease [Streptomyces achromogenes]|uniref:Drug/metabolite transporter (DMT)-like permease n=2 Tax=Streptomyces achromogenes TaxID=67255 RepID=A0ABU0PXZ4_STRAH|nr:drug/metabolite transporter (DMT)-like permease [Streptomyces achromogenes]MDQ0829995.1 drug/metabolite transporter (DMT)-like permease [Streptomyces achromogenes]
MMTSPRPAERRTEMLAAGAAAVTVVLWASAFVSIRSAGDAYSPGALALGRLLSGAAVLGVICAVRRAGRPPRSAWRGIAVSGLLWFGFYMVVLNWGEQQVDAGTAALVVNIGPILIALLGARLLGDAMPPRLLAGMAVSFAGAVAVGLSMSGAGGSSVLGVVLCLLAAFGYAGGVVAQKPALGSASALQVTTFGCVVGAVVCLPFAGQLVHEAADAPVSATLNMVYLGVFPTALAFTTWAYALARTTASRMGATTYAVPALVVLMSWLALGEVPGALTLAGGVLCLAGVAVSRSKPRTQRTRAAGSAQAAGEAGVPEPGSDREVGPRSG